MATEHGHLVRAAGGKYKGWVIVIDDRAKTRPEGPNLTVTPALRLAKKPTANSHWKLTLTRRGLVLEATSGKYKGWFWDFGGNDPSHKESGRDVAVNVLLAERVVALAREELDYKGQVVFAKSEDRDYLTDNPDRRCPDVSEAERLLGYRTRVDLEVGLRRNLRWYRANPFGGDE